MNNRKSSTSDGSDEKRLPDQTAQLAAEWAIIQRQLAGPELGQVDHYVAPFSKQVREEIRRQFPVDRDFHDHVDKAGASIVKRVRNMRISTFAIYAVNLSLIVLFCYAWNENGSIFGISNNQPQQNVSLLLVGVVIPAAAATLLFFLRGAIRQLYFSRLDSRASQFSSLVSARWGDVQNQVSSACNHVHQSRVYGAAWPGYAKAWMTRALFRAKRADYVDRYATTVLWKFRSYLPRLEAFFLGMKVVLSVVAIGAIASIAVFAPHKIGQVTAPVFSYGSPFSVVFNVALVCIVLLSLWGWSQRRPNDFLSAAFHREARERQTHDLNYLIAIPDLVQNLVIQVMDHAIGSRAHGPGVGADEHSGVHPEV